MFVFFKTFRSIVFGRNLAAEHANFWRGLCAIKHSQEAQPTRDCRWPHEAQWRQDEQNCQAVGSPACTVTSGCRGRWMTLSPALASKANSADTKEVFEGTPDAWKLET